jgi:hypothetical protein
LRNPMVALIALGALFPPASMAASGGEARAVCSPEKLLKIVTLNESPALEGDSFARKPKTLYRLGNGKVRLEEELDPKLNVHFLMIANAPDVWFMDLVARKAQTTKDDANPSIVHAPVFAEDGLPDAILALEFGCEAQFIAHADTQHERLETKNGVALKHSVQSGPWKATLTTREGSDRPVAALLSNKGKVQMIVRYLSYEVLDGLGVGLFSPPDGLTIEPMR